MKYHKEFWDKVIKCDHSNLSETYLDVYKCGTPYCSVTETRCRKCKVYINNCGCRYNNGFSGWPEKKWRRFKNLQKDFVDLC